MIKYIVKLLPPIPAPHKEVPDKKKIVYLCSLILALSSAPALLANSTAAKRVPKYVKEIVQSNHLMADYTKILLDLKDYRIRYAHELGFPDKNEYLANKTAEGMQEDEASDIYEIMFINSELSEHEIEIALTKSSDLRADIFATAIIATSIFTSLVTALEESGSDLDLGINTDDPMLLLRTLMIADKISEGLAVMFIAIDSPNLSIDEAVANTDFLATLDSPLYYSDELSEYTTSLQLKASLAFAYTVFTTHQELDIALNGNLGEFLLRLNHVSHPPLTPSEKNYLRRIGITDATALAMLPNGFSTLMSDNNDTNVSLIGNDPRRIGELDFAIIVDLLYEAGSLSPAVYSPLIITNTEEYNHVKTLLDEELEYLDIRMDELVALLHHPERPASLLQVLQLLHKDFSLEDIAELEYATRDAIIVADVDSKEKFLSNIGQTLKLTDAPTFTYLNKLINAKGQLTFILLDNGYELDEIQPHYIDHRFQSAN